MLSSSAVSAATIIVFVNPETLDRHTRVYDTPGRDRLLMCMQPPGLSGCTEIPLRKRNG
jgi:hypothetical protein